MSRRQQTNLWGIVALMIGMLWCFDIFPFSLGEVTIYLKGCANGFKVSSDLSRVTSCDSKLSYSYITYRPNVIQNSVTYYTDDGVVGSLRECSIKDRENWSCQSEGVTRIMKEGTLLNSENIYKRRIWKVEYYLRKYNLMGENS